MEFLSLPARSIHEILLKQGEARPSSVLVEIGDRKVRYGEGVVCARRFASALRDLGVESGDRVVANYVDAYDPTDTATDVAVRLAPLVR